MITWQRYEFSKSIKAETIKNLSQDPYKIDNN